MHTIMWVEINLIMLVVMWQNTYFFWNILNKRRIIFKSIISLTSILYRTIANTWKKRNKNIGTFNLLVKYRPYGRQYQLEHMESIHRPMDHNRIELVQISVFEKYKEKEMQCLANGNSSIHCNSKQLLPKCVRSHSNISANANFRANNCENAKFVMNITRMWHGPKI